MANPSSVKAIIEDWAQKSQLETNPFNKFISLWIAFNAYYISATNETSDGKAIQKIKEDKDLENWYLTKMKDSEEIKTLVSVISIQNMKDLKTIPMDKEKYESVISIIYGIRNNLFHGNKSHHTDRDIEVVTAALPFLNKLVRYCQDNFLKLDF